MSHYRQICRFRKVEGSGEAGRTLVDEGRLRPWIEVEAPWTGVGEVAARLIERGYTGKAV